MALDTATAKADPPLPPGEAEPRRRLKRFSGSRLGGLILALNLLSLLILFVGALLLNEWQRGLIESRQETLVAQAELLANVLADKEYTVGEPMPQFNVGCPCCCSTISSPQASARGCSTSTVFWSPTAMP